MSIRIDRVENGLVVTIQTENKQYQKIAKDENEMRELINRELEQTLVPEPTK
jgi:hypothetical protein